MQVIVTTREIAVISPLENTAPGPTFEQSDEGNA